MITPDTYPNTNAYDAYGNASVATGLCIEIVSIDDDGTAVIRLSYAEPSDRLNLIGITPEPTAVPYKSSELKTFDPGQTSFVFEYDRHTSWSLERAEAQIKVYSDLAEVEGITAKLDDNKLILDFRDGLERNKGYTVVIPANVLCGKDNGSVKNNYNGIYGFISSE